MMTKKELLNVARLAHISVTEQEVNEFLGKINDVITFIDMIYETEHEDVEFKDLNNLKNRFREDEVSTSISNKEALSGTNYKSEGCFVLKKGNED